MSYFKSKMHQIRFRLGRGREGREGKGKGGRKGRKKGREGKEGNGEGCVMAFGG